MSDALTDLRVVELGVGPATGLAGMILADFGAEVVRICRGELSEPGVLDQLPASPMWARGKTQLNLDLDQQENRKELHRILSGADVLLTNLRPSTLQRWGLAAQEVQKHHPHIIYCQITGFGSRGPLADVPGYEHVVAAYAGRMLQFQGIVDRQGPVVSAVQVGIHSAVQSSVTGILAAALQQQQTGCPGRRVETSLLQGMLPYDMGGMIGRQFPGEFAALAGLFQIAPEPALPSLYYHPVQTADGRWMQTGNLLPHLFDNFLIASDLVDVLADPDFEPKQLLFKHEDKHEAFRERMLRRMQEKPSAQWVQEFTEDGGIVCGPYQSTQEALVDPDIVDNGHVIPMTGGGVQLGPVARLLETPASPGRETASIDAVLEAWGATPRPSPKQDKREGKPLAGIKVVEIATIIAAPIGASFLADLGADVIKVEQVGGDPFRSMLAGLGSARVNAGKRSIAVNLKSEQGRAAVFQLLTDADVVIHNYRPGVPERLGIGYEAIREVNPGIVYLQSNGYGPDGPGAHRPSTHPIPGAAMGGVMYQMGGRLPSEQLTPDELRGWSSRIMRSNELNPDPNTGLVVATSVMLGLMAREKTGRGQRIIVDMFGANAYANADDFLSYPGKPERSNADELMLGYSPTYRLYSCGDGKWVFVALVTEKEKQAFVRKLTLEGIEAPNLSGDNDAIVSGLSDVFLLRDAEQWQALMTPDGIACVCADRYEPSAFWLEDTQVRAMEFVSTASHPHLGDYRRHGSLVQFDGRAPGLLGPPVAGQHNTEVLGELGFEAADVARMEADGVLWRQ